MAKTADINRWLMNSAPPETAEDWDPVGEQVYFPEEEVTGILVTMDVTDTAAEAALKGGANLILSHHPMFFSPLKRWKEGDYLSDLLLRLLVGKITVISAHTNLDRAEEGVNASLAEALGMKVSGGLHEDPEKGAMGLVGTVPERNFTEFLNEVKKNLDPKILRLYGRRPESISKIAVCGGSGADFMGDALEKGADLYITGDMKYHDGQRAYENRLAVLDIGHFDSEKFILPKLKKLLEKDFPEIPVTVFEKNEFQINVV